MKLNRRGFFKRSASVGAAIAVSPLLIGGKDGGTGPGTAVTAKAADPAPRVPDALFESSARRNPVIYMSTPRWLAVSDELVEAQRDRAQHQPRDERGRFSRC